MAYEIREGEGSLFDNNNRKSDASPHKTGKCKIDGKEYYISCWNNTTKNKIKNLNLKFKSMEDIAKERAEALALDEEQEEMPF